MFVEYTALPLIHVTMLILCVTLKPCSAHCKCFSFIVESLNKTKVNVKAALADDFDTLRAVDAVMDLIHHGNRQLKAVSKVTHQHII